MGGVEPAVDKAPTLKRSSSRRSLAQSEAGTGKTQRSSYTTANYRYKNLTAAEIHIHTIPPKKVQASIRHILKPRLPKELLPKLRGIAQELHEGCRQTVNAGAGEDDFVHLMLTALKAISFTNLCLREKADWKEELKPIVEESDVSLSFLENFNAIGSDQQHENDNTSAQPPSKRLHQFTGLTYISPQSHASSHLPLPPGYCQGDLVNQNTPSRHLNRTNRNISHLRSRLCPLTAKVQQYQGQEIS